MISKSRENINSIRYIVLRGDSSDWGCFLRMRWDQSPTRKQEAAMVREPTKITLLVKIIAISVRNIRISIVISSVFDEPRSCRYLSRSAQVLL
jgi:hypothetical protein